MKCKAFVIKTTVYKSGDTSVRFYMEFCVTIPFLVELSGDEFIKYFELVPLSYPMCYLESFEGVAVFSVGAIRYAVKARIEQD